MTWFLLAGITAVPLGFYVYWWRRGWWFLDPINTFWPIYLMFGVLQPAAGLQEWRDIYGVELVDNVLMLYLIAGLLVCFGFSRPMGTNLGRSLPVAKGVDEPRRYLLLGYVMLAVGLLAQMQVIRDVGGRESYLTKARTAINYSETSMVVIALASYVPASLLVILCTTNVDRRYVLLRNTAFAAMSGMGLWSVYGGSRSQLIFVGTSLFGVMYGCGRRNPPPAAVAVALAVVVVGVGFTTVNRGYFVGGGYSRNQTTEEALDESLKWYTSGDTGGGSIGSEFGISMAVVRYAGSDVPYDLGYMMLELFTRNIPRAMWPDKIYPGGKSWDALHRVAGTASWTNSAGYLTGPAPGLIGKWYYMFGVPGVILGSIWTGIFLRTLQTYVHRYSGVSGILLALGFVTFGFSEMNNPFEWILTWLFPMGVGLFMVVVLGRTALTRRAGVSRGALAVAAEIDALYVESGKV